MRGVSVIPFLFCVALATPPFPRNNIEVRNAESSRTAPRNIIGKDVSVPSASRSTIWQPKVGQPFQMILSLEIDINSRTSSITPDVEVYDVDLFYTSKSTISQLKRLGKKVICYFSAGTSEDWRPDYKDFTAADKGSGLPLWVGENYVNIRSSNVFSIMTKRIELAAKNGCDAVDPDNMDVYINEKSGKFNLTEEDAINYLKNMSQVSHSHGMSIGLKNVPWLLPSVIDSVEFCVAESCVLTKNCSLYGDFTTPPAGKQGRPVFHVEYVNYTNLAGKNKLSPVNISSSYIPGIVNDDLRKKLCLQDVPSNDTASASKLNLSTVIKTMDLDGWIMTCDGQVQKTKTQDDN